MNSLDEVKVFFEKISEELNFLKSIDENEMYKYLINFGKKLEFKNFCSADLIKGCTSNVYLFSNIKDLRIYFNGYADSLIVRGYLAILIEALSGLILDDVINSMKIVEKFANDIDITSSLSFSRANAFSNIYTEMLKRASK